MVDSRSYISATADCTFRSSRAAIAPLTSCIAAMAPAIAPCISLMGIPAVKAGVVESECCHGRAPAHHSGLPVRAWAMSRASQKRSEARAFLNSESVGVFMTLIVAAESDNYR